MDKEELMCNAEKYRFLYRTRQCSREEATENIQPYLDFVNNKAKEIAKKYNQRPKMIHFAQYVR